MKPDIFSHNFIELARKAGLDGVSFHKRRHGHATQGPRYLPRLLEGLEIAFLPGHCQVDGTEAALRRETPALLSLLALTSRRFPGGESSLSEEAKVDRLKMMTSHSEQIVNRPVD